MLSTEKRFTLKFIFNLNTASSCHRKGKGRWFVSSRGNRKFFSFLVARRSVHHGTVHNPVASESAAPAEITSVRRM